MVHRLINLICQSRRSEAGRGIGCVWHPARPVWFARIWAAMSGASWTASFRRGGQSLCHRHRLWDVSLEARTDPRVVVWSGPNAMHVVLPEPVDLVTVDVAWTPRSASCPTP